MDRRRLNWVICIKFTWAVILKIFVTLFIEGNVLIARAHKSFRFIVNFNKNIFFRAKWSIKYEYSFKFKLPTNV